LYDIEQYFFALSIKVLQRQNIMQTGQNALQDLKEEQDCCARRRSYLDHSLSQ
jgi:hypothetical protein